jgi:2,3-bisphosphoglycerate-independent phosphoglycerate mutase
MKSKVILLVCDGLGDRPIAALDFKTPLEAARTPNLNYVARKGVCGLMHSLGPGLRPGSDTSHLNILGYDYHKYYSGRGPIEVAGLGMELKEGDVALRGNLGTVDEKLTITDRRAGRILDVSEFVRDLDNLEIDGVKFLVKPGTAHRAGIIMRGENLSNKITDADPHETGEKVHTVLPRDSSPEAKRTAGVLNRYLEKSHQILLQHPENERRRKEKKPPANYLLVRGAGFYKSVPSFSERFGLKPCCVAGGGLYKGIGAYLGMEILNVEGATALPDTNIDNKFDTVKDHLGEFDFFFVHVKAADSLGEDGDYVGKKEFIGRIDQSLERLLSLEKTLLVVTADHSTPCSLRKHSADPVPICFCGLDVRSDSVAEFGERACASGGLGRMLGLEVMPEIINILGLSNLVGA